MIIIKTAQPQVAPTEEQVQERVQAYLANPERLPAYMELDPEVVRQSPQDYRRPIVDFVRSEFVLSEGAPLTPIGRPIAEPEPEGPRVTQVPPEPAAPVAPAAEPTPGPGQAALETPIPTELPELYERYHAISGDESVTKAKRDQALGDILKAIRKTKLRRVTVEEMIRKYFHTERIGGIGGDKKFESVGEDAWLPKREGLVDKDAPLSVDTWILDALRNAVGKEKFKNYLLGSANRLSIRQEKAGLGRKGIDTFLTPNAEINTEAIPEHLRGGDKILELMFRLSDSELGPRATQRYPTAQGKIVRDLLDKYLVLDPATQVPDYGRTIEGLEADVSGDADTLKRYLKDKVVSEAYRWGAWEGDREMKLDDEGNAVGAFPSFEGSRSFAALENMQRTYSRLADEIDAMNKERQAAGEEPIPEHQLLPRRITTKQGGRERHFVLEEGRFWEETPAGPVYWPPEATDPATGELTRSYRTGNNHHASLISKMLDNMRKYRFELREPMEDRLQDLTISLDERDYLPGGIHHAHPAMSGYAGDESSPQSVFKRRQLILQGDKPREVGMGEAEEGRTFEMSAEEGMRRQREELAPVKEPRVQDMGNVYKDPRHIMVGDIGKGFVDEITEQLSFVVEKVSIRGEDTPMSEFVKGFYDVVRAETPEKLEKLMTSPHEESKTLFFNLSDIADDLEAAKPTRPNEHIRDMLSLAPGDYASSVYPGQSPRWGVITPIIPEDAPDREAALSEMEAAFSNVRRAFPSANLHESPETVLFEGKRPHPGARRETKSNLWEIANLSRRGKEIELSTGSKPDERSIRASFVKDARDMAQQEHLETVFQGATDPETQIFIPPMIDPEDPSAEVAKMAIEAADAENFKREWLEDLADRTGKRRAEEFAAVLEGSGWQNADERQQVFESWAREPDRVSNEVKKENIMSFILSEMGGVALNLRKGKPKAMTKKILDKLLSDEQYNSYLSSGDLLTKREFDAAKDTPGAVAEWSASKIVNQTVGKAIASFFKRKDAAKAASERRVITAIIHDLKAIKLSISSSLMVKVA